MLVTASHRGTRALLYTYKLLVNTDCSEKTLLQHQPEKRIVCYIEANAGYTVACKQLIMEAKSHDCSSSKAITGTSFLIGKSVKSVPPTLAHVL